MGVNKRRKGQEDMGKNPGGAPSGTMGAAEPCHDRLREALAWLDLELRSSASPGPSATCMLLVVLHRSEARLGPTVLRTGDVNGLNWWGCEDVEDVRAWVCGV